MSEGVRRWRIADGWFDTAGVWQQTGTDTHDSLLRSMGLDPNHPEHPETPTWFVSHGSSPELHSAATITLERGTDVTAVGRLPMDLPLGAHHLHPDDDGPTTNLFVVPSSLPLPARGWGLAAQLYGARSAQSWGHGDLNDLGTIARFTERSGGTLLAHNPVGASIPVPNQQPSPYYPSSRRFISALYLRIEDIAGAELVGDALQPAASAGQALNSVRHIDRDRVWALKLAALESIWAEIGRTDEVVSVLAPHDSDPELTRHGLFCALAEHYGTGWQDWPTEHRHPDGPASDEFRRSNADRVRFWVWVHLEGERQLEVAAGTAAGLMADLAVGFDPGGSDAWGDQDLLALDCSIGAPGDEFNPAGQNWGLPPYIPWKLRATGYQPWIDCVRRLVRNCVSLRIDHVMGLFRLFWIPEGADASRGGYVYQYGSELLDLAMMEAAKAGVWLAGEDLGTVENEVRSALASRNVLGYKIGWFEDEPPSRWPSETIGSITTHDLPTIAGIWDGADSEDRLSAGLQADPDGDAELLSRLQRLVQDGDEAPVDDHVTRPVDEVILAAHRSLARAGSRVVLAGLEDAFEVYERPNLPGTSTERENWALALPRSIDRLGESLAMPIAAAMRARHVGSDDQRDNGSVEER